MGGGGEPFSPSKRDSVYGLPANVQASGYSEITPVQVAGSRLL